MQRTLAIIDVDIHSGEDETAREALLTNLQNYQGHDVAPLWLNLLRERADLRVVCLVRDLARLDDFLIDVIRTVPGVRGTSARLAFGGSMRADVINELPLQDSVWTRRATATVFVKIEPGKDRAVCEALSRLPSHREVQVAWTLRLFHSPQADLKLMLIGERSSSLTGFVMSWIRTVPGVVDTQMTSVIDWRILGQPDDFIELSECFPEAPAGDREPASSGASEPLEA